MFYDYRQNNSDGGFDVDKKAGISVSVIVEADDAQVACILMVRAIVPVVAIAGMRPTARVTRYLARTESRSRSAGHLRRMA